MFYKHLLFILAFPFDQFTVKANIQLYYVQSVVFLK